MRLITLYIINKFHMHINWIGWVQSYIQLNIGEKGELGFEGIKGWERGKERGFFWGRLDCY
jgi:hypothetical protein